MKRLIAASATAIFVFAPATMTTAFAADGANANASCAGILSDWNHTLFVGARAAVADFFKDLSEATGIPAGQFVTTVSQDHDGSVGACLSS